MSSDHKKKPAHQFPLAETEHDRPAIPVARHRQPPSWQMAHVHDFDSTTPSCGSTIGRPTTLTPRRAGVRQAPDNGRSLVPFPCPFVRGRTHLGSPKSLTVVRLDQPGGSRVARPTRPRTRRSHARQERGNSDSIFTDSIFTTHALGERGDGWPLVRHLHAQIPPIHRAESNDSSQSIGCENCADDSFWFWTLSERS